MRKLKEDLTLPVCGVIGCDLCYEDAPDIESAMVSVPSQDGEQILLNLGRGKPPEGCPLLQKENVRPDSKTLSEIELDDQERENLFQEFGRNSIVSIDADSFRKFFGEIPDDDRPEEKQGMTLVKKVSLNEQKEKTENRINANLKDFLDEATSEVDGLKFVHLTSSVINAVSYNMQDGLFLMFIKGKNKDSVAIYQYPDVPAYEFVNIINAKSVGSYVNGTFQKNQYNYTRRFDLENQYNLNYVAPIGIEIVLEGLGIDVVDYQDNKSLQKVIVSLIAAIQEISDNLASNDYDREIDGIRVEVIQKPDSEKNNENLLSEDLRRLVKESRIGRIEVGGITVEGLSEFLDGEMEGQNLSSKLLSDINNLPKQLL